ncbi:putative dienelactone hydrolase protein [Botrytis cinerea BcDW1]|uniref:Putative dienelactone hydrolase protein n=1 Tax=Botryotinia fuckeliana (strain BcDW1) TaxID=1290391 RepID=M7UT31_BOTF1|nr:putative dienelactone hydrolase protein [Botrytis cinerea BcDW1]
MTQPSAACCKGTPISLHGPEYKLSGEFIDIGGTKYYVTGPENATSAIVLVYDIFGFWTQTLLGAEILATTKISSSPQGIKVFVPDFFGPGNEADIAYWPADTGEKWDYIFKIFENQAEKEKNLKRLGEFMNVLKERDEVKNVKSWGIAGYCWGAKIVTMASQEGTIFKAGAQTHPSLVDPEDAKLVTIPQIVLLSKDENKEQCKTYENNVKVEKYFEAFDDQVHGWMSSMLSDVLKYGSIGFMENMEGEIPSSEELTKRGGKNKHLKVFCKAQYAFRGLDTNGRIDELVDRLCTNEHKPVFSELVKFQKNLRQRAADELEGSWRNRLTDDQMAEEHAK